MKLSYLLKRKLFLFTYFLVFFYSCHNEPGQIKTQEQTISEAIHMSNLFNDYYLNSRFDSCLLVSKGISEEDFSAGRRMSDSLLGKIQSFSYVKTEIEKSIGTNGDETTIKVFYNLKREKKNCTQVIYLEGEDTLKVVGFEDKFELNEK